MIARCITTFTLCASLFVSVAVAQTNRQTGSSGRASLKSRPGQRQQTPAGRLPGNTKSRPPAGQGRPVNIPQKKLSPKLEQVLLDWERASSQIEKIQGQHQRIVYDMVFKVEKWSYGKFYHEVPDKGRIDIEPAPIAKITQPARRDPPKTGKPFDRVADQKEKWVCDGKRLIDIDEENKTAAIMSIPPRGQGESIMNGPLPFLFGMPAETAKKRYNLEIGRDGLNPKTNRREIELIAMPKWRQDSINWSKARIILDYKTFLPLHVKLIDSAGTKETVFSFSNFKVETKRNAGALKKLVQTVFKGDPFRPSLKGYKIHTSVPGGLGKPAVTLKEGQAMVPDIVTATVQDAKDRLIHAGFKVAPKLVRGGAPPNASLVMRVRTSTPAPMTPLKKGSVVKLVVYEDPRQMKARK